MGAQSGWNPRRMGSMLLEDYLNTYAVKNGSNVQIPADTLVEITALSTEGAHMSAILAQSTASRPKGPLMVVRGTIPAANDANLPPFGNVRRFAVLKGLNTSTESAGDPVYLSETIPGGLLYASSSGGASHDLVQVGIILSADASDGQILLDPGYYSAGGSGGAATTFAALTDTAVSSPLQGQVPVYISGTSKWTNTTLNLSHISQINAGTTADHVAVWDGTEYNAKLLTTSRIADIDLTGISAGQYVTWNGSALVATTLPSIPANISDLGDVDTSGVSNGDHLVYNSASGDWEPSAAGAVPSVLNDLTDCNTAGTAPGHYLRNIGGVFTTAVPVIEHMSNVDLTGVAGGDALVYNGSSAQFEARAAYDPAMSHTAPSGSPAAVTTSLATVTGMTVSYTVVHGNGDSEINIRAKVLISSTTSPNTVTLYVYYDGGQLLYSKTIVPINAASTIYTCTVDVTVPAGSVGTPGAKTIELRAQMGSGTGTVDSTSRLLQVKETQIP